MRALITAMALLVCCGCSHGPSLAQSTPSVLDFKDVVDDSQTEFRAYLLYEKGSEKPFTGKTICRYPSGHPKSPVRWAEGRLQGTATDWHENGAVKEQCGWEQGNLSSAN